jgi:hypothetical protein
MRTSSDLGVLGPISARASPGYLLFDCFATSGSARVTVGPTNTDLEPKVDKSFTSCKGKPRIPATRRRPFYTRNIGF